MKCQTNLMQKINCDFFTFQIFPVDDETPRLTVNNGLELDFAGEVKVINNDMLMAEDLDSSDPDLVFIIRQKPKYGVLQRKSNLYGRFSNMTQGSVTPRNDVPQHIPNIQPSSPTSMRVLKNQIPDKIL